MGRSETEFGPWLRRQIEARLLTQTAFAAKVGVARSTLADWLAGNTTPRGVQIVRLSRALHMRREQIESHLTPPLAASCTG